MTLALPTPGDPATAGVWGPVLVTALTDLDSRATANAAAITANAALVTTLTARVTAAENAATALAARVATLETQIALKADAAGLHVVATSGRATDLIGGWADFEWNPTTSRVELLGDAAYTATALAKTGIRKTFSMPAANSPLGITQPATPVLRYGDVWRRIN